ncbi:zinc ABC transporter substrate-binding protein ZnuA [Vibrio sp. IRLE0018]|uniref:zinc ABC transporter substrate-binding protein ZnuA n=1 Tax=Vibrio floridensis TaxID=2908007 RepID=UPI001F012877|nr:zinc ABC transporter substrate-binding protein ZnuA [Vibrio floridensis]MCF8778499.1 zinc ABC transporter substrate-binding protein ZnuA [Vibrio floridensis]
MIRFLLISLMLMLPFRAMAIEVLTSIKPLQLMVNELMLGVDEPLLLVSSNASPHDYALKPSDVKKIRQADLVIWFGQDLEPFLTKLVETQPNVLTISDIQDLPLREYEAGHAHDGHDHGSFDPHFWMGINIVEQIAPQITQRLIEIDAANTQQYQANLASFLQRLTVTDEQLRTRLSSVKSAGYFVFHDAYGYFEQHYQLNNLGYFTVSPERKPGAKTLIQIRNRLAQGDVKCVFAEPQFTPAVIESVLRGSDVKKGLLDPIGSEISLAPGSYFEFLLGMGDSFFQCLSVK